eukprot:s331_g14.t1
MLGLSTRWLEVERARDLRMLGPFFLSLSVQLSLGSQTSEPTSSRWGSEKAGRIDLLKLLENGSGSEGIAETVEVELFAEARSQSLTWGELALKWKNHADAGG